MKWLNFIARVGGEFIGKMPIEKMLVKERDRSADREELKDILEGVPTSQPEERPIPQHPTTPGILEPRKTTLHRRSTSFAESSPTSEVTLEETVSYQNREIGKLLLRMERHFAQKLRINGKPCDCGATKHLLDMEAMAEETVSMVSNPKVYYRLIEWVGTCGPMSTEQAAKSGAFDEIYPSLSVEAREFRKELMGTVDPHALWPQSQVQLSDIFNNFEQEDRPGEEEEVS